MAVGWLSLRARHHARDPQIEITLSLITPYIAYWIPEHFGGSGVIATVACGLYISWNGPLLISSATRLQGIFFWDLVIYLIEGMLFLLTGFQMRLLFEKSKAFPLQRHSVRDRAGRRHRHRRALCLGLSRNLSAAAPHKRLRERDPSPPWRHVRARLYRRARRGVACRGAGAAVRAAGGEGFPYRDLILFVTFGVIFMTLVGLGSGLPLGGAMARRRARPAATSTSPSMNRRSRRGARRWTPRSSRSMP